MDLYRLFKQSELDQEEFDMIELPEESIDVAVLPNVPRVFEIIKGAHIFQAGKCWITARLSHKQIDMLMDSDLFPVYGYDYTYRSFKMV